MVGDVGWFPQTECLFGWKVKEKILLVVVLQKALPGTDCISKNCVLEYVWSFYIWIPEPCLRGLWNMRVTQCFLITESLKTGDTSSQWKDPHFWTKQTVEMVKIFAVLHSPICSFEIPEIPASFDFEFADSLSYVASSTS